MNNTDCGFETCTMNYCHLLPPIVVYLNKYSKHKYVMNIFCVEFLPKITTEKFMFFETLQFYNFVSFNKMKYLDDKIKHHLRKRYCIKLPIVLLNKITRTFFCEFKEEIFMPNLYAAGNQISSFINFVLTTEWVAQRAYFGQPKILPITSQSEACAQFC